MITYWDPFGNRSSGAFPDTMPTDDEDLENFIYPDLMGSTFTSFGDDKIPIVSDKLSSKGTLLAMSVVGIGLYLFLKK